MNNLLPIEVMSYTFSTTNIFEIVDQKLTTGSMCTSGRELHSLS